MLIGITGCAGSGKDTVAKMIQYYFAKNNLPEGFGKKDMPPIEDFLDGYEEWILMPRFSNSGWKIKKFASKLKKIAAILVGCKEEDFESEEFKSSLLPDSFLRKDISYGFNFQKPTVRWLLQTLGTEVGRNINKDIWVNSLMAEYNSQSWIISDVRYLNEEKAIKDRHGIILKIVRGAKTNDTHSSEVELDSIYPDWTIYNDDSIEKLYENVCDFLELKKFK